MSPKEASWTQRVVAKLKKLECHVIPMTGVAIKGIPDRLVLHKGQYFWLEFKGQRTRVTDIQLYMHQILRAHGAKVFIVRYPNLLYGDNVQHKFENVEELLNAVLEMCR